MVTQLAQHSNGEIQDRFSGLGLPVSFQQQVYANHDGGDAVKLLNELYRRLCRGEDVQVRLSHVYFLKIIQENTLPISVGIRRDNE